MATLCFSRVDSESDFDNFDCGNESINQLIKASLYSTLLNQTRAYKLSMKDFRVGFVALSISRISCEYSDADFADFFDKDPSYGAIFVDYIAVDKSIHRNGIGSTALKYIIKESSEVNRFLPIRFVVLDALRSKYEWYEKHGFLPFNSTDVSGCSETIRMYLDIMPEDQKRRLGRYIKEEM